MRNILKTDNREIVRLCKKASIVPKKDKNGQTYFSYNEVQDLKNVQGTPVVNALTKADPARVVDNLLSTLETMEKSITDSMSKIIDEKLDGMDEVVVELIRCKTENETLRHKINELNKTKVFIETYKLRDEDFTENNLEVIYNVATRMGMLKKNGYPDTLQAAYKILRDYRSGKLGLFGIENRS